MAIEVRAGVLLCPLALLACPTQYANRTQERVHAYEVVVYGGTPAGIIAAVAAAREGARVALLEPRTHLGGMVSGGLGRTDIGDRPDVIGGYALEFFERVARAYGRTASPDPATPSEWHFEPKVAERVFEEMLSSAGVRVFRSSRLRERSGVSQTGTRIDAIRTEAGERFEAVVFIDATYEGDLMARAGVSYTWGREPASQYGESLAGVRAETPRHNFVTMGVRVRARDERGKLLAGIHAGARGQPGAGDRKVQAYNFRVIITDVAENRVPFPEPRHYDPSRYALLLRLIEAYTDEHGRPPTLHQLSNPLPIPNGKYDVNNNGPVSTNNINMNWDYPDGDVPTRERIWQDHVAYVQGFFYFLAHDPRVPEALRAEMSSYGLARDEFADNGHWPYQLYVREARRMLGTHVMTQHDLQTHVTKPDAIGMGSYRSDSHNVQRFVTADGYAENEGNMEVRITPYEIPYRMLVPRRVEATNLLVAAAFSASHVAYSTLRMEPQYMIAGHAAGVAASMAAADQVPVQDVDVAALQARLRAQRALLELPGPQRR